MHKLNARPLKNYFPCPSAFIYIWKSVGFSLSQYAICLYAISSLKDIYCIGCDLWK